MMRAKKDNNWPKLIKIVVRNINATRSTKHGFAPAKVASPIDDQKVRDAMIERKKFIPLKYEDVKNRIERYNKSRSKNIIQKFDVVQKNLNIHQPKKHEIHAVRHVIPKSTLLLNKESFFPFQPTKYYVVQKVNASAPELMATIKDITEEEKEPQTFYENSLVKSKIPQEKIVRVIRTEQRHNKRKISLVKLKGIRNPIWIDNGSFSFSFRRVHS